MHIVIPGALPPASVATDLSREIGQHSPTLIGLFERLMPRTVPLHPAQTGCTPAEYFMLAQHGWVSETGSRAVGALASLQAEITSHANTGWVAQMCVMSIGNEHVSLTLPDELELTREESARLMNDVLTLTPPFGFTLTPIDNKSISHAWRVAFDEPIDYVSISPQAVRGIGVTDWWPQHPSTRLWRKWLNEVQMSWYNHPINQDRMDRGLLAINGLWLYGGGPGWTPQEPVPEILTLTHLEHAHAQGNWSDWIHALRSLEHELIKHPQISRLILLGDARMVVLTNEKRNWWTQLLGSRNQLWSRWWNPPA